VAIEIKNIVKRFGAFTALDDVELKVANGELLALLGPSGSGKTTLLRIIAGLDWPDSGSVAFDGEDALAQGARERHVGFVFQHYALFRHMTVFENVARRPLPEPAVRRPAPAHRTGPGAGDRAAHPLARRAVRRAGREGAQGIAAMAADAA
jgi:sulfate transport system ATP-binding protein